LRRYISHSPFMLYEVHFDAIRFIEAVFRRSREIFIVVLNPVRDGQASFSAVLALAERLAPGHLTALKSVGSLLRLC
jgi:hypothetical protein